MDGVVLTPEEPKKVEVPVQPKPVEKPKEATLPREEFEGVYYNPSAAQIDGMYENPVRVTAMGRDERVVPRREDSKALDGVLMSDQEMMRASTNFNLDLDDNDDLDNKNDDFYDE